MKYCKTKVVCPMQAGELLSPCVAPGLRCRKETTCESDYGLITKSENQRLKCLSLYKPLKSYFTKRWA